MKNKYLLPMMLLCFACFGVSRAAVVQIGDAATSQNCFPIKTDWYYSLTQQIFTAEEIGIGGTINSISFYYVKSDAFSIPDIQVYMKHTSKTQFDDHLDMVQVSPSDMVFEGTFSASGSGWVTLTLDTPFSFDGSSNLLLCFYSPVDGYLGTDYNVFSSTETIDNMGIAYYSDHTIPDITNVNSYSGGNWAWNFRADIRIDITPSNVVFYQYDFEDTEPFEDWTDLQGTSIATYASYAHSGTNYLIFSGTTSNIVALPKFSILTNELRLEFWCRPEKYTYEQCGTFSVGYMTDLTDASSFVELANYSRTEWTDNVYQKKIVNFEDAPENAYIAFRHSPTHYNYYWYVDDVIVRQIPTCPEPTNVNVTAATYNGFTATFTPGDSNQNSWICYWSTEDEVLIGQNYYFTTGTTFTIDRHTMLLPGTTYYLWIGALCPDGTYSWSQPTTFTTRTPMTLPFYEEFADGSNAIPEGWTRYTGLLSEVMAGSSLTSTNYYWNFSNYNRAFNGSFHACSNIYGTGRKHWLVTPAVSMSVDCLLSFDLAYTAYDGYMEAPQTNGSDDKFVVLVSTNYGHTWQILRQWDNAGSPYVLNDLTPEGKTVELDLSAYTGQNVQVAFYVESTVSNADNNLHIDNVNIDTKPPCWDMKVQDVTLSNITPYSVMVSWTPTGATQYYVQCCVADDFNDIPFYEYATSSNSCTFGVDQWNGPLDPETQYYVHVAPNCPENGLGPWSEVVTFTTAEICPAPYNVTIDSVSAHGFWASFTPGDDTQDSWEYCLTTYNYPPDGFPGNTTDTTFGYINSHSIYANTTYYLWIGVYCEEDQSYHISEPAEFTTPEACFPPTNLVAHTTPNSATITWTPSQPEQNHWTVELVTPGWGDYPWEYDVDEPIITFDAETLNGLLEEGEDCYGKTYTVYVYSECGEEDGTSRAATLDFVVEENDFITLYDGTVTNNRIPAYIFYFDDFTKSQFIIPAEDLSELIGTSINSLTFYTTASNVPYTTESTANVYLKEVDYTSIDAFESKVGATTVYSGYFNIVSADGGGQLTITFDQPYYYQGGNLLVGIENTEDIDYMQIRFYGQVVTNASISGSNGSSSDDVPALQQNFIPKTTIGYIPTCDVFSAFSLPYTYGFEDADEFGCWTMLNCANNTGIYSEAAYQGNNGFRFYYNTNPPQYLISPKLDATTYVAVLFYYRNASDTYPETFQVGYSTTTKSPNAFIWHDEVTAADQTNWMLYNDVFPAGTKYVAVKLNSYDQLRLYLDNFSFIPETCPTPHNIHVTDITPTQATLNWENGEGNDTWVVFRRAGQYETAYYESFEHEIDFFDWSTVNMGTSEDNANEFGRSTEAAKTGSYGFKFTSYYPDDNGVYDQYLISPNVSEWQSKVFRFDYKSSFTGYERFKVGFSSTDTNIESFTWGDEIVTSQTEWQTYQGTIPADAVYIAIHYCSNYAYDFYVDDFTIFTGDYIPATDWYGFWATSPFTITQYSPAWGPVMYLEPNTKYEFQMITACDGGVDQGGSDSDWTEVMSFTTLDDGFKVFVSEGDWSTESNWSPAGAPTINDDVIVRANAEIPDGCVAYAYSIVYEGSPTPTITIKDGGQLRTNENVDVIVEKNIAGYGSGNGKYYLLSNPLWEDLAATEVEGMIPSNAADYDLYLFNPEGVNNGRDDEHAYREWRNYKAENFEIERAHGYLYANKEDVTLRFTGNAVFNNYGFRGLEHQYDENTEAPFGNWLLTGNIFTCNCYLFYLDSDYNIMEVNFYVMNEAGTDVQLSETQEPLKPCEGAFVEIPSDGMLCYMSYLGFAKNGILNITLTQGEGVIDQARVRFGEGHNLDKLSLREKSTISIPQDGKDFAVVYTSNRGEMPVSFKALTDGTFTMSFSNEEVEFSYLHLIDNLTGEDIDLLDTLALRQAQGPITYTFKARTTDRTDRFKVVFVTVE